MQITKKFKDPLTRQANEGVRINNRNKIELLNSKTEFNHPPIPRITVERKPFFKKKFNKMYIPRNELNPGRVMKKAKLCIFCFIVKHVKKNSQALKT